MRVIKAKDRQYIPASHEKVTDPYVWKKILLTESEITQGNVQMINWAKLPVGNTFQKHYHEDMDEIFILIQGKARMVVDAESIDVKKGDVIVVTKKEVHSMTNYGNQNVYYIVVGISFGNKGKTITIT